MSIAKKPTIIPKCIATYSCLTGHLTITRDIIKIVENNIEQNNFSKENNQQVPVQKPNKLHKIFPIILLGLTTIIISVLVGIQIGKYQTINQLELAKKTPIPQETTEVGTPNGTDSLIDTDTEMQNYINTRYNYQITYPSEWVAMSSSMDELDQTSALNLRMATDQTPATSGFSIFIAPNPDELSLIKWAEQNPDQSILLPSDNIIAGTMMSINGIDWEKFDDNDIGYVPTGQVTYGLAHNNYLFYVVNYSADREMVDKILSTFRFID